MLVYAIDSGVKIDLFYYRNNFLKPVVREIKSKDPKMLSDSMAVLRHMMVKRFMTISRRRNLIQYSNPDYSTDLPLCDYWLNSHIKMHLGGQTDEKSRY